MKLLTYIRNKLRKQNKDVMTNEQLTARLACVCDELDTLHSDIFNLQTEIKALHEKAVKIDNIDVVNNAVVIRTDDKSLMIGTNTQGEE